MPDLTLYHGTLASRIPAIKAEGLKPPPGVSPAGWFMLTTSFEQAARYTPDRPDDPSVVLEYRLPENMIYAFSNPNRGNAVLWPGQPHNVYGFDATAYAVKDVLPSRYLHEVHSLRRTAAAAATKTFYRLHHRSKSWDLAPTSQEFRQTGYDEVRRRVGPADKGYSCFENPWHLWDYVMRRRWDYDNDFVAVFPGTEVGRGTDNEPLAIPSGPPTKLEWEKFERWLMTQPMGSKPEWKGGQYGTEGWGNATVYADRILKQYDLPGWERLHGVKQVVIGQTPDYGPNMPSVWFVRGKAKNDFIVGGLPDQQAALAYAKEQGFTVVARLASVKTSMEDYMGGHTAPSGADDVAAPFHDVEEMMPDYYTRPDLYRHDKGQVDAECVRAIRAARGKPDAMVTIYRALPPGKTTINKGDWVTPSLAYARQHAISNGEEDWPVISAQVPAKTLWTEGYPAEWGYGGPSINARLASLVTAAVDDFTFEVSFRHDWDGDRLEGGVGVVYAKDGDSYAGSLFWNFFEEPPVVTTVSVEPQYRRQGLATRLWEIAKSNESRLTHSDSLTDDGKAWSQVTAAAIENDYSDSVMICLKPSDEVLQTIADMDECTEDLSDLHLTLFYFGDSADIGGQPGLDRIHRGLYDFALHGGYRGLTGILNGFGIFQNESDTLIGLWDIPGISEFRTHLMAKIREHGVETRVENHGFTPHLTLAYDDAEILKVPRVPVALEGREERFTSVWLVWGEEWTEVTLS